MGMTLIIVFVKFEVSISISIYVDES